MKLNEVRVFLIFDVFFLFFVALKLNEVSVFSFSRVFCRYVFVNSLL